MSLNNAPAHPSMYFKNLSPVEPSGLTEAAVETSAAPLPTVLWIELTSKCPYDCIFCSRSTLRGAGEHMEFDLFRSIMSELRRPEIIRLNYSGESIHHPRLLEALEFASKTGAVTELVSAFSSFPARDIERFVASGAVVSV